MLEKLQRVRMASVPDQSWPIEFTSGFEFLRFEIPFHFGDLSLLSARRDEHESWWLNSGDSDENGFNSYFINKHYDDGEKLKLWNERGDKERFRWQSDMRRPAMKDEE